MLYILVRYDPAGQEGFFQCYNLRFLLEMHWNLDFPMRKGLNFLINTGISLFQKIPMMKKLEYLWKKQILTL